MLRRQPVFLGLFIVGAVVTSPMRRTGGLVPGPNISYVLPAGSGRAVIATRTPLLSIKVDDGGTLVDTYGITLIWDRAGATPPDTVRFNPSQNQALDPLFGRRALTAQTHAILEWQPDSAHGLNPGTGGDSALVTVKACDLAEPTIHCRTNTRWLVLPHDSTAVLGFSNLPVETFGGGFAAPFGPGIAVSGADIETGFSTVPYFSFGGARSAGLVYSTRQSYPRVLVPVDVELRWPASGAPSSMVFRLYDGAVKLDTFKLTSPTCTTGSAIQCHAVLQADFSASSFPVPVRKELKVEVAVTSGAATKTSASTVEAVIVDRRGTMYGAGWWPSAASKLVLDGENRILVGANGSATLFRGNQDSIYLSPPGSASTLTRTAAGWELTARGTTAKVVFDSLGRVQAGVDRNGNRDSVAYVGSTDTVAALVDPLGKRIGFSYANGRLSQMTSLPSEGGERKTAISIDATSNQLLYDSVSSPTSRPYTTRYAYQSYPGTKTNVLTQRIGVVTDTTVIVYDSTFLRRPVQAKLPLVIDPATGNPAKPTISYTAMESRGYHALVRNDSAGPYVEMKDPRGNWTRSWLNRWGQARVSWDTLGVLSRATYSDDGFLLWAEGKKTADTTRTRYAYNSLGFLVKSWIVRAEKGNSVLRTDSLVYDVYDRVIRRVDSRGKVDSVQYDANGNVTRAWDPAGNLTQTWYKSDGRVDSAAPAAGGVYRYSYEATWKQPAGVRLGPGSPGVLMDSTTYDDYGRATASGLRKTRVTGTTYWQWKRTLSYYTVANQVDSVATQLSNKCADPCSAPGFWGAITELVGTRFDRAGRDSVRVSPTGATTTYLYDRLGRLLSRRPPSSAGSPPRDSMVYDLAGMLVRSITRLGDTVLTSYDSRNRDTSIVVPRYGTIKKVYGGPLGQLTRVWVSGLVDSIGGVNPEVRYAFDARGRLVIDTAYAGSTVLTHAFAYDTYERDSVMTDARGTWRTRYDTDRGLPATLVTPFSDSLTFTFNSVGQLTTRRVLSSGPQAVTSVSFSSGQELTGLGTTVGSGGSAWNAGNYDATGFVPEEGPPLGPTWSWQRGSGTGTTSLVDTIEVDGSERMLRWRQGADGDSVSFDSQGNVYTVEGSEVYDSVSQRLLSRTEAGGTWAYSYDAAGNQTQAQWTCGGCTTKTWIYGYDGLSRLVSARYNGTVIARYGYDVLGRRIVKRVYSTSTGGTAGYQRFTYAGDHISQVRDSAGTTWSWAYTWGNGTDDLVGFTDGTTQYYVAQDKLGSIRGVWKRDGTWVVSQRFTPYGKLLARDSAGAVPAGLRYSWTGREHDAETGLYYFRARFYDSGQRRFTQEDPIGFGGGANLYAYVDGAVMEQRDPSGLIGEIAGWVPDLLPPHKDGGPHEEAFGVLPGGGCGILCFGWDGLQQRIDDYFADAQKRQIERDAPNLNTKDKYMDDPRYRAMIDDNLENAPEDLATYGKGYRVEVGGWCTKKGCTRVVGEVGKINIGPQPDGALFAYHSHPNVGMPGLRGGGDYAAFPSDRDYDPYRNQERTVSTYIFSSQQIARILVSGGSWGFQPGRDVFRRWR